MRLGSLFCGVLSLFYTMGVLTTQNEAFFYVLTERLRDMPSCTTLTLLSLINYQ